jgi:hypothetical protein
MHEMSFWELVKNSPEWISVFANALFAVVTISVIIWQVCVMKWQGRIMVWQGRNSSRNERTQNKLIRLQHEHEWMLRLNAEREQLLKSARELYLSAVHVKTAPADEGIIAAWGEVRDSVYELDARLNILDMATLTENDNWYPSLRKYVDAILQAAIDDGKLNRTYHLDSGFPVPSAIKALDDAAEQYKPVKIFLDLEAAIRLEFFDFKNKWDEELPS